MSKQEFIGALYNGLSGLPKEDIENSVQFYGEMIDDRMDEGMTENEAVEDIGSVNEIIQQILSESSLPKLVKRTVSKKTRLEGVGNSIARSRLSRLVSSAFNRSSYCSDCLHSYMVCGFVFLCG